MAKRYIPVNGVKIRKLCQWRSLTLRELARRLDVEWTTLANWIYEKSNMPPEQLTALAEILGVEEHVLERPRERDLRKEALAALDSIAVMLDIGDVDYTEMDFMKAWKIVAPYFLTKPRETVDIPEAVGSLTKKNLIEAIEVESLRNCLVALQAGDVDVALRLLRPEGITAEVFDAAEFLKQMAAIKQKNTADDADADADADGDGSIDGQLMALEDDAKQS